MTLPQIERDYIKTGKLRYVFRDFPLESIHKQAFKAHEAANCAGDQEKYWQMHNRLFANQQRLRPKDLSGHAEALGLDLSAFEECLNSGRHTEEIRKDLQEGSKAGIRGTPTFLIGPTERDPSKVKTVQILRGALPYARFKQVIDQLLSSKKE